jgi:hypothetical protein
MLLRRTAQQNEAPPAELYCSLEVGFPERVAPVVFGFLQRGEFPKELTGFCSGGIQNTQSTTCISLSFCAFSYSLGQGCQRELIKITLKILLFT